MFSWCPKAQKPLLEAPRNFPPECTTLCYGKLRNSEGSVGGPFLTLLVVQGALVSCCLTSFLGLIQRQCWAQVQLKSSAFIIVF